MTYSDCARLDPERLRSLRRLGLLDAPAEEAFDRLTRLTVRMLDVPVSLVSLVDDDRDFYLSLCGVGEPLSVTRELGGETFCHHVLAADAPLAIDDTRAHPFIGTCRRWSRWASPPTWESRCGSPAAW